MKSNELKSLLDTEEEVLMYDVRERDEFAQSGEAVEGSENVPAREMLEKAERGELPKDKKIVTICKSGNRCEIVADDLREKGYNIDFLEGGVEEWHESGSK